jgi:hypothetical protein
MEKKPALPYLSYRLFAIFILNASLQFFFSYSVQQNKHYTLLIWPFCYKPPSVDHADWFRVQIGSVCCEKRLCADWFHQETTVRWLVPPGNDCELIDSTQKRRCADWFDSKAAMRWFVRLRNGYALIGPTQERLCADWSDSEAAMRWLARLRSACALRTEWIHSQTSVRWLVLSHASVRWSILFQGGCCWLVPLKSTLWFSWFHAETFFHWETTALINCNVLIVRVLDWKNSWLLYMLIVSWFSSEWAFRALIVCIMD